jgi:hypothetical protein
MTAETRDRSPLWRWLLIGTIIAIIAITLAYRGGSVFGDYLVKKHREEFRAVREQLTDTLLVDMGGTIAANTPLPDWTFLDLEAREQQLSKLIHGRALIMIADPQCDACLLELQSIHDNGNDELCRHVILISAGSVIELIRLRRNVDCPLTFLYDQNALFTKKLNVLSLPLNLIVKKTCQLKPYYLVFSPSRI